MRKAHLALSVCLAYPGRVRVAFVKTTMKSMGLGRLKTPFHAPQANVFCERLIGRFRRECRHSGVTIVFRVITEW